MQTMDWKEIEKARKVALEVLIHNAHGPYQELLSPFGQEGKSA